MERLVGVGASPGIAIGVAHVLASKVDIHERRIAADQVDPEIQRFEKAIHDTDDQLARIQAQLAATEGDDHQYRILEAHRLMLSDVHLVERARRIIRDEKTAEGYAIRRIYDLPLRRSEQPVFLYGWSLLHVIDEASPLAGATAESLNEANAFLLLTIGGTDETTGQTLMARYEYPASRLRWNHTFVDYLSTGEDGIDRFDYTKFHDVDPLG